MERRVSHLCHHVLAPGCPCPRRLSPLCSDVPCTCPEGTSGLSAAAGSQGASVPSARSVAAALGNAARVYLAVLPGGHRAACGAGLPPHPVPSRGPSHSVEEEIQPLTMTIRPPHLPRVSLSAQWGRRCFVYPRAGPRPSRPCAGLLGRGLHAAGGGVPTTPTGRRPPRRRLLPSSPRCSLLLPWFPHLTSGCRPGGQGPLRDVAPSRGRTPALHALRELPTARLPAPAQRLPPHLLWAGWAARARVRAPSHDGRRPELPPSRFLEPQFPIWLPLHATPSCCSWLISVQPPPASVSWAVTATHNSATAPRHDFSVHGHLHRAPSAGGSGTRGPSAACRARPARPGAAGCAGSLLASRGGASSSPGPDSAAVSSSWTQVET